MIITIDGPAGSGKSSLAHELAKRLHMHHLRTGLLYRAAAFLIMRRHQGEQKVFNSLAQPTVEDIAALRAISYTYEQDEPVVCIDGKNVGEFLDNAELDYASSTISSLPEIREQLLKIQRKVATQYDIVAEGRDCGSIVFPQADYKFFLTATPEVRADRVMKDLKRHIQRTTRADVLQAINDRDERDKVRKVSPLIVPSDAHYIDNSSLNFEETVTTVLSFIKISR